MEHYVTLFDSLFLPQGLALHMSMQRHVGEYTLWILCVDDEVYEALIKFNLPNVQLLQLSKLETPELLAAKPTRSNGEYCWTLTPFAPRFVFEANEELSRVTYIDADIWFLKNPELIFKEFEVSGKDVLITDHAYAPEYDQSATSGQYCVQFMTFTRLGGEVVRKWWEDSCVEWCFARFEPGRFGDQKYLDDWPTRFEEFVHVLTHESWTQAPWNATRFPYSQAIFYHFHGLRIASKNEIDFGSAYCLPNSLIRNVYDPYITDIASGIKEIINIGLTIRIQTEKISNLKIIKRILSRLYSQIVRFHNLNYRKI